MTAVFTDDSGKARCNWCAATAQYIHYHDTEWGFPVTDDFRLFEKICLEGFQSGLSWRTVLEKRDNFREVFHNFDFYRVAQFGEEDVEKLLQNAGIIRHRGKIEATINNAKRACEMVEQYGSLAGFFWSYEPETPRSDDTIPSTTPESVALSKKLKKLGWKFVGPTTAYAFMQAMGLVNDHDKACYVWQEIENAKAKFVRPISTKKPTQKP